MSSRSGKFIFPIAVWRQKRFLLDAQFGPPSDRDAPALDSSDDEFGVPGSPKPPDDSVLPPLAPPVWGGRGGSWASTYEYGGPNGPRYARHGSRNLRRERRRENEKGIVTPSHYLA